MVEKAINFVFGMCSFLRLVGAHSSPRQFSKLETASLLFFSMLTREFVLFQEIVLLSRRRFEKDDLLEEDIHKLSC